MNLAGLEKLSSLWNLLESITRAIVRSSGSMARSRKDWGRVSLTSSIDYRQISFAKEPKVIRRKRFLVLMKWWMRCLCDYVSPRIINGRWFLTMWIENSRSHLLPSQDTLIVVYSYRRGDIAEWRYKICFDDFNIDVNKTSQGNLY